MAGDVLPRAGGDPRQVGVPLAGVVVGDDLRPRGGRRRRCRDGRPADQQHEREDQPLHGGDGPSVARVTPSGSSVIAEPALVKMPLSSPRKHEHL